MSSIQVDYSNPQTILHHGHEALHDDYATRIETSMGKALPQMEVRVKNLSLSAQVSVSKEAENGKKVKQQAAKPILHSISAVFQPGTMTLVLGQPGSGKSSLLKVLSGRFPVSKTVTMDGEITYNGVAQGDLKNRLPQFVSYVPQRDRHFPTLTVKETLEFAHECCGAELSARDESHFTQGTPDENKQALEAARALYRHYPEVVLQQLGLEDCQDTIVGDAMLRGVSGGQRKRVTTGEMEFGNKYVTLMDEISTGLDSAATFDIVKTQRSIAKKLRKTVVMALLQPAPEVFDLFDYVLILNQGYVMYHGPRDQVVSYFQSLGFESTPGRDIADFLMDLGTSQQMKYEVAKLDKAKRHPRRPAQFAQLFQESQVYLATLETVHSPHAAFLQQDTERHFDPVPEFHLGFWQSTWALVKRELKVTWRNLPYIQGRFIVVIVIGLIYSTLFYQFDPKNVQVVMGTIFPAILFFTLGQSAQLPLFMEAREIFYKQRGANFYRTSSYVFATAINQIPLAFLEVVVFGLLVYWLCGFVAGVGSFFVFEFILFVTNLAFAAWFFFLASITPNLQVAQPIGMMSVLFYILFAGFILTHNNIPDYFLWAYWLNPISWALRSLAINQYGADSFDTCTYDNVDYCGQFNATMGVASLNTFDIYSESYWIWLGAGFMVVSFVVFMALAGFALEHMRYDEQGPASSTANDQDNQLADTGSTSSDGTEDYQLAETPRAITVDVTTSLHEHHFTPVTLAFKDLWYSVPNPTNPKEDLELLKGISGFATPGTITALMGSSGAGKTTLMDVIAGRKTGGKIRGEILLNGYPATDLAIRRSTGYCEQMDIHSEAATIREALTFSAFLRQDASVSDAQKYDSVEECLDLLDMRSIADQIIRGSSVEQMKRLTIGVELAAQPSVLFLDEPTSGLDARSAKVIMDGVRKVADTGRTVVCTIHQPSAEVFSVFDSLLLLKRGGETVYFGELGPDASELINYFQAVDGVKPIENGANPATWMLEAIGAGVGGGAVDDNADFASIFNTSSKKSQLDGSLQRDGVGKPAPGVLALEFNGKRAASEFTQAKFLIQRFMTLYWRTPDYNLTRFVITIVLGLIFGLAFGSTEFKTYQGINAGVGMIFTAIVFVGAVSFDSVRPMAIEGRNVFYRERAAQTYNAFWYFVGSTLAEIPYVFISTFAFTAIFFPTVGFSGVDRFAIFWVHMSLHVLLQTYMGQFLAFILPSLEVSATVGMMVTSIFFLFMGFNPPASLIPGGYKWLYQASPPSYTLGILSSIVFGECDSPTDFGCQTLQEIPATLPPGITVKEYIASVFLIKREDLWMNFGIIVGCIFIFRVLALLALRFINHQKK